MKDKDFIDNLFANARVDEPYLADDGFSAGVLSRLHAMDITRARPAVPFWQEVLITVLFTLVGGALTCSILPLGTMLEWLPLSLVISPVSLAAMAVFSALISLIGYWVAEAKIF